MSATLRALDACGIPVLAVAWDGSPLFCSTSALLLLGPDPRAMVSAILAELPPSSGGTDTDSIDLRVRLATAARATTVLTARAASLGERVGLLITLHTAPADKASSDPRYARLTRREREVAAHIVTGSGYDEIARQLGVTVHTVRRHTERIFMKFGVQTRARLMAELRG
jgi:DNA-binding CsgD family transcriptional regulator